ncbi:MAG: cyclic nucleotide-binding domain-containing protein [Solirubrobacterales bacterium]|nr:cyclic nucleotide-binding domain-containing protein [Solirubrobacterales bacterium]
MGEADAVAAFLARHPPFDGLTPEERYEVAAAVTLRPYPEGHRVLVEDGEPAACLYVIRSGAMDLVHADQVVDVLLPGACFGHPSLLTQMAPAFTVRARSPSTCLLVPREAALDTFAHPSGVRYIAHTLRQRLVRTGYTAHALPELSMTRVGALLHRPALILPPGTSIREAAATMTAEHLTAVLVETGDGVGIVTDADLREKVLAQGRSPVEPVGIAVRRPVLRLPADRTASEALVDLLDAGQREACVISADGRIAGLVSVDDIAGGEHSPFALRRTIARAADEESLVATVQEGLPALLASLLSAGLASADISRALAVQSDTATVRLLELAFAGHGTAPASWAWLALGSVARRELTLASDQDNALAYADDAGPEADAFFARVASDVNAALARCGLGEDEADVLARDPRWRMSESRWRAVFQECLEFPDRSHLVRAAVSFDFRMVVGGLDVVPGLVEVIRDARRHPGFIRRLARTVTDLKVPLGRRGQVATGSDGCVDLKLGGALPIANVARLHAIAAGITISGTVDRLIAAEATGSLEAESAVELREAFAAVSQIRLEHHADCLRAGRPPDNRVDPLTLPPLRRAGLRDALRAVQGAQRRLSVFAPLGM